MVNKLDWNALDTKIQSTLEDYPDLDRSKILCAVSMSSILDISVDEAIDALTDGASDRGVDALFVDNRDDANDIHIFQSKCVDKYEKSQNNFPSNEIDKVVSYVNDLVTNDAKALANANSELKRKTADAIVALKEPNATITVYFVGNLSSLEPGEFNRIQTVFDRYNQIKFEMFDLERLSDYFLQRKTPKLDREITVVDTNFFDRSDINLRGMVCTVAATDIVNAIASSDDPTRVEDAIFDQNVRLYLKRKNRINKSIIESALSDQNHMFWYNNNGITITCDRMEVGPSKRSPKIMLRNFQIVNGGQTSNCLFEAAKQDSSKIEDVVLLVRIIETSSEDIQHSIAETTNSQTPINSRDLRSNDRQQRILEEAFGDLGYFYERKTGQHADRDRSLRIDAAEAGQAFLAYECGLPEVAKKDRGRVFGNLYDDIFSENITADKLLVVVKLAGLLDVRKKELRTKIRKREALDAGEMAFIDGTFHMLFAVRQLCNKAKIDIWDFKTASTKVSEASSHVMAIYEEWQKQDETFSSNRFFKDAKTKDLITARVGA